LPPGDNPAAKSGTSPGASRRDGLFSPIFTTDELAAATSDHAWVTRMLEFEAALAVAEARAGVVPAEAATAIVDRCRSIDVDLAALGHAARLGATPVIPLVAQLRRLLPPDVARWAHFGATSQDVLDTALMLVLQRALDLVAGDLARLSGAAAALAEEHRSTVIAARTLLQHAAPTTFGRKAAGWLVATVEVAEVLRDVRRHRLAVQLGGPAGTLAALGASGVAVVETLASELGLGVPVLPWHTDRTRVAEVSSALALAAGVAAKIALDVSLLMQTEVSEVFEPSAAGRGASSSLPHKRNPSMAAEIIADGRRAAALAGGVLAGMAQEHERAVGAWQAEWQTMSELARAAGGAVAFAADLLSGLEVDGTRMQSNLALTRGLVVAERVTLELAPHIGYDEARRVVEEASRLAAQSSISLEEALSEVSWEKGGETGRESGETAGPGPADVLAKLPANVFDPAAWLGSSELYVDQALDLYRKAYADD
jgi:3-carboxy-cis,cis-muconate cycloisomerase